MINRDTDGDGNGDGDGERGRERDSERNKTLLRSNWTPTKCRIKIDLEFSVALWQPAGEKKELHGNHLGISCLNREEARGWPLSIWFLEAITKK